MFAIYRSRSFNLKPMSVIVYQFQTVRFIQMMSLTFGLFTQVSCSGPLGPLVNFWHRYCVRSNFLILFEIILQNLVQKKYDQTLIVNCYLLLHFFGFMPLCNMVSIEIVSFCRIIPLCNFQYRNHVHSITLISFQIISQTWYKYKA